MNDQEERNKIAVAISETAELYGKEFSQGAIRRFVDKWDPRDSDRLEKALDLWDEKPRHSFMPTITDLKRVIGHLDPTEDHSRVKGYWLRKRGMLGRDLLQDEIDEACKALGIPLGKIKQGEIEI